VFRSLPVSLNNQQEARPTDDRRLVQRAGLVLPIAVWVLGLVSPPPTGLTVEYVATYTFLLAAIALVDQTTPPPSAPVWRRFGWLVVEIVLCGLVVRTQGTLIRPALIYLLPVGRAILLLGERRGLLASLLVWIAYIINIAPGAWPDRLGDFANYLSFFLAPYAVAVILSLAIVRQERARQRIQTLYDQLSVAHHELQDLQEEVRDAAVAQERNRLAREIHDSLAHYLTVANVQLEAAEKLGAERAETALEHVRRARRLTLECLHDVRRSVAALRAATLEELAIEPSLRRLVREFAESTGLSVHVNVELDEAVSLSPELAQALYRAVQEGLTNVHKHAQASGADVTLRGSRDLVTLEIHDNGVGTTVTANGHHPNSYGYGLVGLRERVALLDGELSFGPSPRGGSCLKLSLPLRQTPGIGQGGESD
jgi:signal transduction histidine kinase